MPALRRAAGGSACNAVLHSGIEHERRLTLTVGFRRLVVGTPKQTTPERYNLVVDSGRVRVVLLRIAADIDELARARSVEELEHSQVDPDARAERRRRLAEPPLAFPAHGKSIRQCRQALYGFEKERWRRGEADSHPFDRDINPPENGNY